MMTLTNWSIAPTYVEPHVSAYSAPEQRIRLQVFRLVGYVTGHPTRPADQLINTSEVKSFCAANNTVTTATGSQYTLVGPPSQEYQEYLATEQAYTNNKELFLWQCPFAITN